jgi:hypothetical protein
VTLETRLLALDEFEIGLNHFLARTTDRVATQ